MELVDSVLAFALVMAALASIVTLIMEALHRALRLRAKGMEALFDHYYKEVLSKELKTTTEKQRKLIREKILHNPAKMAILASSYRIFPNSIVESLTAHTEVTSDELLRRLDQSGALDGIKKKTVPQLRGTLERIEAQYDEYSVAMSDYFKRRAKLFSLVVGILLAFGANIDGVRIYETLKVSPAVRAKIVSQQEKMEASYQASQDKLNAIVSAANKPTEETKKKIADLKNSLDEAAGGISEIASLGLPIGWSYFPANTDGTVIAGPFSYLTWFFKVLITGLLIGLGAPFWFEVAQKLTRIKQGLRGKPSPDADEGASPKTHEKTTIDKIIENVGQ